MENEKASLEVRWERFEELEDAIEELSDSIYDVDDLESSSVAIDLIASKLSVFSGKEFDDSSPKFFLKFVEDGLDPKVLSYCKEIEEFASENLYDDNEDTEDRLEEAESTRESLYDALSSFVEALGQELDAEEVESEQEEGNDDD